MTEKEKLIELVKTSSSFTEILRKQGKAVSGSALKVLKNSLDNYGISYLFINEKEIKSKIPIEELLVENKRYKSSDLKRRLIQEGLKQDICELCGQTSNWNNKFLTLQLDHINGNHNDNRLENLRIVCPNCHSQTETFSNKRSKKHNYCIDCGCEISRKATRCSSCSAKHKPFCKVPIHDRPTKEKLASLIQIYPFTTIGKMYNVSDNTIRKWCKYHGLPSTKKELRELL